MPSNFNVALIGCGRIAGHHARAIDLVDGVSLTALCDLDEEKAKAYADLNGASVYTNYHHMMQAHPEIDLVSIITPSGMHYEHGLEIVELYEKSLIVEKPTFLKPSQLREVSQAAASRGLRVFPVFQNRYNSAVARIKEAIENDELGETRIVSVRTRWCRPQRYYDLAEWRGTFSHDGGALTNQGIHHVDLLRYLAGEVEDVNATMTTLGADIEVEDTVVATFRYASGAVGNLEITTAARPDDFEASLSIVGSKGLAQIGGIAVNELQVFTPDPSQCELHTEDFGFSVYGNGHEKMYRDIVDNLNNGSVYPVDVDDAESTLRLLHAFYRSDELSDWVEGQTDKESSRLGRKGEEISELYRIESPSGH